MARYHEAVRSITGAWDMSILSLEQRNCLPDKWSSNLAACLNHLWSFMKVRVLAPLQNFRGWDLDISTFYKLPT